MDAETLAVLQSPELNGCVGFKPETIAHQSNSRSACTTAVLRYLGAQNNQYSVSLALSNLWPERSEWLAPYIYFRRNMFKSCIYRDAPAECLHVQVAKRAPALYLEHRHGGPWRTVVAYDPNCNRFVLYDPSHPDLWITKPPEFFDQQRATNIVVMATTVRSSRRPCFMGPDWLPKHQRADLWYTTPWPHVAYKREHHRRTYAA
jgi:hypothetical protein